jgi:hypothetical protein
VGKSDTNHGAASLCLRRRSQAKHILGHPGTLQPEHHRNATTLALVAGR